MKLKFILIFIVSILLMSLFAFTPTKNIKSLADKLTFYNLYYKQEKIYITTDKPLYAAGEELWFKVFALTASFHTKDTANKVVYVELFDAEKVLVKRLILPLVDGSSVGDFHLSDSLPQDKYVLRAYTNHMKNFSDDFYFTREIQILNPDFKSATVTGMAQKLDLQFFPEGGNFVAGILNRVAFKAINQFGKSVEIEGNILDEKDSIITNFKSAHSGMGFVNLTPAKGKKYKAKVFNYKQIFTLPGINAGSLLLKIDDANKNIRLILYRDSEETATNAADSIYIVAHTRGIVYYAASVFLAKSTMIKIPKMNFPSGIVHFTVFDKNYIPQCERLVFINHRETLQLSLDFNKTVYKQRDSVNATITVRNKEGQRMAGNFSMSIYDTKVKDGENYPLNINSYLLLTSELQGQIENPGYYFKDTLAQTKQHLDLLMMTHGWSRFVWKDAMKDTLVSAPYFIEKGITISGKVRKLLLNRPAVGSTVKLFMKTGDYIIAKTDSLGRFYVDQFNYYDSTEVTIQTDNSKGKQSDLRLDINPFNPIPSLSYEPMPFLTVEAQAFLKQAATGNRIQRLRDGKSIQLKEVEVKSKKDNERPSNEAANGVTKLHSYADYTLKAKDIGVGYIDILSALQGRVPGFMLSGTGATAVVSIRGGVNVGFIIDGMAAFIDQVMSLNPGVIESVDVLTSPANLSIYGGRANDGIIAIYTKRGQYSKDPSPGISFLKYPGYYKAREFYLPKYYGKKTENMIPDVRTTLYWNPKLATDSTGKTDVSFYTSDISSDYKIVIEGISNTGIPAVYNGSLVVK